MNEQKRTAESSSNKDKPVQNSDPAAEPKGKELTPEEQMALYEKELKENDWGHQPC
jgi:hypothetical protein